MGWWCKSASWWAGFVQNLSQCLWNWMEVGSGHAQDQSAQQVQTQTMLIAINNNKQGHYSWSALKISLILILWMIIGLGSPPRCDECAKFSARIASCSDLPLRPPRRFTLRASRPRGACRIFQTLSIESARLDGNALPTQSCVKIDFDGLNQAKTRWPRNLRSAKVFSSLWRPNLHIVGFICHGVIQLSISEVLLAKSEMGVWQVNANHNQTPKVCEGFLILDNDIPNDASMELTCLDMVLDWAAEILESRIGSRTLGHRGVVSWCPNMKNMMFVVTSYFEGLHCKHHPWRYNHLPVYTIISYLRCLPLFHIVGHA